MGFPFNLYGGAFLAAIVATAAAFPLWKYWCEAAGHVDHPGQRKIHVTPIPLAGGLAVFTGFFVPLLLGFVLVRVWGNDVLPRLPLQYGFSQRTIQIATILAGALGMLALGWLDDRYELRPKQKFAGQLIIAALVAWAGIRITLFVPSGLFSYVVTILWILTVTNAFNFMDNMNGLCTGLGVIASWACAWSAAVQGQYLVALLGFVACGALLGFLPFNFPRAAAFLGDAGSHLVGYLVAILAILPNYYSTETPNFWAVVAPIFILSMPLLDLLWVVIWRLRTRQPVYVGDTNHLSHQLVRRGLSKTTAVLLIWLGNAITATAALLLFT